MSTVRLYPAAPIGTSGGRYFTIGTSGQSTVGTMSDDSDATYFERHVDVNTALRGFFESGATDFTLPAGAVTRTASVGFRIGRIEGKWHHGYVTLYDPADPTWGRPVVTYDVVYGVNEFRFTPQDVPTPTTFQSAPHAVSMSGAQINGLQFHVGVLSTDSEPGSLYDTTIIDRIYKMWADVVYVLAPGQTISAPTGTYTESSRPSTRWAYVKNDTDNGPQAGYEIAWFAPGTYSGAGFTPDRPPAGQTDLAHERIVGSSAASTAVPTRNQHNGTAWRCYVRVAEEVNGRLHWSAWTYSTYTIQVDPPRILSVDVEGNDETASVTILVTRDETSPAWEFVNVERLQVDTAKGWETVRGATFATPASPTTFLVVDDEVPNGQTVRYRASAGRVFNSGASTVIGDWVTSSNTASWSSTYTWFKDPHDPTRNRRFRLAQYPDDVRTRRMGLFQPLNSDTPIGITGQRMRTQGTLTVTTFTDEERDALEALTEGTVILIQSPPGYGMLQRYVMVGDTTKMRASRIAGEPTRRWPLPFWEVKRPADNYVASVPTGGGGDPSTTGSTTDPSTVNPSTVNPSSDGTVSSLLVPSKGCWFGSTTPSLDGTQDYAKGLDEFEAFTGVTPAIQHLYRNGNSTFFPTAHRNLLVRAGKPRSMMLYNWKVNEDWSEVAAGLHDDLILAKAAEMRAYPYKFFLTIAHEPENDTFTSTNGKSYQSYRDMWNHVIPLLRGAGRVTNAVTVINFMGFAGHRNKYDEFWPGPENIDWIAWDPYAHSGDTTIASFLNDTSATSGYTGSNPPWRGFYTWATLKAPGKPLMLGEWGFGGDVANATDMLNSFANLLESTYPAIKAVVFWNSSNAENNELQTISISGAPTGGTFTLSFGGKTTAGIARNATAATVQTALRALSSIGTPRVVCTGGPLPGEIVVEFRDIHRASNVALITANGTNLTGGTSPSVNVVQTRAGVPSHNYVLGLNPVGATRPSSYWTAWPAFAQDEFFWRTRVGNI